jgi:hypothetical protein
MKKIVLAIILLSASGCSPLQVIHTVNNSKVVPVTNCTMQDKYWEKN